jgi:hypothetical protein
VPLLWVVFWSFSLLVIGLVVAISPFVAGYLTVKALPRLALQCSVARGRTRS